ARFEIRESGSWRSILRAQHLSDTLGWDESELPREPLSMHVHAPGTFATALAVHGLPLIRSPKQWSDRHRWSDLGEPEGLAYKIGIFEAVEREHGYVVVTPRLPGIPYPSLAE